MKRQHLRSLMSVLLLVALSIMFGACEKKKSDGKMPITSSSDEARSKFLNGRTLSENLRTADSIGEFQAALQKDPNFALAHLYLALTAATYNEFFDHLNQAITLSDKASEGERLYIMGVEAGSRRDPMKQRELYQKLADLYPTDERVLMLLGVNYFTRQDYPKTVEYLKKATEISPSYAPAYNQLGYSYLFLNQLSDAEKMFKKYTELIPNDPNPFDSYAGMLLKTGRFEEAIEQYRKALSADPHFISSYNGIAAANMYAGNYENALAEIQKAYDTARNDGEKRTALLTKTVIFVDQGKHSLGLQEMKKQYAIAEKNRDVAGMSNDLFIMGTILLEMGKPNDAKNHFEEGTSLVAQSGLPSAVKNTVEKFSHYYAAQVALMKKDFAAANAESDKFCQEVEESKAQRQIRFAHEVKGMIAFAQKNNDAAIAELEQANQQDAQNLYRIALAYQAKGEKEKAGKYFTKAAKFYGLPSLTYAFIRTKAEKML